MKTNKIITMAAICYVCNKKSFKWRQHFAEIKSEHSNTSISDLISKFLRDFKSTRDIQSASNRICLDCLGQINAYDGTVKRATEQENHLHNLLVSTEAIIRLNNGVDDSNVHNETVFVNNINESKTATNDSPGKSTTQTHINLQPQKTIMIRKDGKLFKLQPVISNNSTGFKNMLSSKDCLNGLCIKTSNGKILRIKKSTNTKQTNEPPISAGKSSEITQMAPSTTEEESFVKLRNGREIRYVQQIDTRNANESPISVANSNDINDEFTEDSFPQWESSDSEESVANHSEFPKKCWACKELFYSKEEHQVNLLNLTFE